MYEWVNCCPVTRNKDVIYYDADENSFKISSDGFENIPPIEYCPWCRKLLDLNMTDSYRTTQ